MDKKEKSASSNTINGAKQSESAVDAHHAPQFFSRAAPNSGFRSFPQTGCYFHLIAWISRVSFNPGSLENLDHMKALCFRWFTLPRTRLQMQQIVDVPMKCNCTQPDSNHATGVQVVADHHSYRTPGRYMLGWCAMIMEDIDDSGDPQLTNLEKQIHWPSSMDHLFPYGAESTTRSLVAWIEMDVGLSFMNSHTLAIDRWTSFVRPRIRSYLITSAALARGLSKSALRIASLVRQKLDTGARISRDKAAQICGILMSIAYVMVRTISPGGSIVPHVRAFVSHCPRELLLCCDKAVDCLNALEWGDLNRHGWGRETVAADCQEARNMFALFGGEAFRAMPWLRDLPDAELPLSSIARSTFDIWYRSIVRDESPIGLQWLRLVYHIAALGWGQKCHSSSCSVTVSSSLRHMRACGQCLVLRYCSQRCQRKAWNHSVVPHRKVCGPLKFVCAELNITKHTLNTLNKDKPQPRRLETRIIAQAVEFVLQQLNTLAEHEMTQPWYRTEEMWKFETFQDISTEHTTY